MKKKSLLPLMVIAPLLIGCEKENSAPELAPESLFTQAIVDGYQYNAKSQVKIMLKTPGKLEETVFVAKNKAGEEIELFDTPSLGSDYVTLSFKTDAPQGSYDLSAIQTSGKLQTITDLGEIELVDRYISNGGFEEFAEQSVTIYERSNAKNNFLPDTTYISGGPIQEKKVFESIPNRPLGFSISDDLLGDPNATPSAVTQSTEKKYEGNASVKLHTAAGWGGMLGAVGIFHPENLRQETFPIEWNGELPSAIEGYFIHEMGGSYKFWMDASGVNGTIPGGTIFYSGFTVMARFINMDMQTGEEVLIATADYLCEEDVAEWRKFSAPVKFVAGKESVQPTHFKLVMANCPHIHPLCGTPIPGATSYVDDVDFVYEQGRKSGI